MTRPVAFVFGVAAVLIVLSSCAPSPRFNDPEESGFDPNYPIARRPVAVPVKHEGRDAVFASEESSIFVTKWMPVGPFLERLKTAVTSRSPGWEQLKARYLDAAPRHSVQSIADDHLVGLLLEMFFAHGVTVEFSAGTHRVVYADGTSSQDQGVRLNMKGDPERYSAVRRSYADAPLVVGRDQRRKGERHVRMILLVPERDTDKEVVRIERVGSG